MKENNKIALISKPFIIMEVDKSKTEQTILMKKLQTVNVTSRIIQNNYCQCKELKI